ncbi:hypothetical protein B566_EDAN013342, partial [Ephemera danica]
MNVLQNNAEKECMNIYNNGMIKSTKGKFLKKSEMDNLHKEFASKALKVFDNLPHFGNQDQLKNARYQCEKMIDACDFRSNMEEKVKMEESTRINQAEDKCMEIYKNNMRNVLTNQFLGSAEMEDIQMYYAAEALKVFDSLSDFESQKEIRTAKSKCIQMIEASDYKSRMEEKLKSHLTTLQNNAETECMNIYNDRMARGTNDAFLQSAEMDKLHKESAAAALEVFDNLPDFVTQEKIRNAKYRCSN